MNDSLQNASAAEPLVQVVGPADNWILERLAKRLVSKLPYAVFSPGEPNPKLPTRIAYYVNYALFAGATSFIDVGFFTHLDEAHDFLGRARQMDHCISMSKLYADWLREQGVEAVTHIPMGFDYFRYRPKLVLGVVGRLEHPRKGAHLVEQLKKLPFVEIVTTQGRLAEGALREIYQRIDYVLIPATVEGGPLCLLEGLAMGKPIVAPEGLGIVPEFGDTPHVRRYTRGDFTSLRQVVVECYLEKALPSRLVQDRTWDQWAEDHHQLFARLLQQRGETLPGGAAGFRFGLMGEMEISLNVDVESLELSVDQAARHLFYGDYAAAQAMLQGLVERFPCVGALLETIPYHDEGSTAERTQREDIHQESPAHDEEQAACHFAV